MAENQKRSPKQDPEVAPTEPTKVERAVLSAMHSGMALARSLVSHQPEEASTEIVSDIILTCLPEWLHKLQAADSRYRGSEEAHPISTDLLEALSNKSPGAI